MLMGCLASSKVCMKGLLLRELPATIKRKIKTGRECSFQLGFMCTAVRCELDVCFLIPDSVFSQSLFEINHLTERDAEACQEPQSWPHSGKTNKNRQKKPEHVSRCA